MKFVAIAFVILVAVAQAQQDESHKKAAENMRQCAIETGTTKEAATRLRRGDFTDADDNAKCFIRCFFKRAGFLNDNEEIQKDIMISKLGGNEGSHEKKVEAINKCALETGANNCEHAYNVYKCFRTEIPVPADYGRPTPA